MIGVEPTDLAIKPIARAGGKDFLDGSLADEKMGAILARDHDGQAAACEIEGNLIDLGISSKTQLLAQLHMFKYGLVEQVSQS